MMRRLRSRQAGHWGRERGVGQPGGQLLGQVASQTPGEPHVQRNRRREHLVGFQSQALEQQLGERGGQRPLAFQAHRRQAGALLQDALHVLAVVLVLLVGALGGVQVGVAGDADDVGVLDGVHAEHLVGHHLDGVLEQDEGEPLARQLDDARALARHGHESQRHAFGAEVFGFVGLGRLVLVGAFRLDGLLAGAGLLVQAHHHVQRAVLQVGEGVARVDDLRREEGHDVLAHVAREEGALLVVEVAGAQVAHALLAQKAADLLVGALLDGVELVAARVDGVELLGGRHAGLGVDDVLLHQREVGQASHAHHEELLQVAPEDGDEVQALQKRHRLVGALIEHALVEGEPRKLAVLQIRRRQVRRSRRFGPDMLAQGGRGGLAGVFRVARGRFAQGLFVCFHGHSFPCVSSACRCALALGPLAYTYIYSRRACRPPASSRQAPRTACRG